MKAVRPRFPAVSLILCTKIRALIFNGAVAEWLGKPLRVSLRTVWRSKKSGTTQSTTITPRPSTANRNSSWVTKSTITKILKRVSLLAGRHESPGELVLSFRSFFWPPFYKWDCVSIMSKSLCFVLISVGWVHVSQTCSAADITLQWWCR